MSAAEGQPAPRAALYLATAEDAEAGRHSVAGLPVAFRALMSALDAGCRSVAVPDVYRATEVERAIARSPRASARVVWISEEQGGDGRGPMLLVPATLVVPKGALRALRESCPVAVLGSSPAEAPAVLADETIASAVRASSLATEPGGDTVRAALARRRPTAVGGGWSVRATDTETRSEAERRLYADMGSPADTWLDRRIHRPVSRHVTRAAVALGLSPNVVSLANLLVGLLAVSCLAMASVRAALLGVAIYYASVVLDHVDGEVARLTYAESRLGEWLDVAVDNVVHASMAVAMGVSTERVAGHGQETGIIMAAGFALSALAARMSGAAGGVPPVLTGLGNRDGFYGFVVAFVALLAIAPAALPALLVVAAIGAHAYWVGHVVVRFGPARAAHRLRRLAQNRAEHAQTTEEVGRT